MQCANCGGHVTGRYCGTCGHPAQVGGGPAHTGDPSRHEPAHEPAARFGPAPSPRPLLPPTSQQPWSAPPPPPPPGRTRSGTPRGPVLIALVVGLVVGLVAVAGLGVWWRQHRQAGGGTTAAGASPAPSAAPSGTSPSGVATAPPTQPGTSAAVDPQARLESWRDKGLMDLSLDGHWVAQLSSKYDGVIDNTQTAADGDHTFSLSDIAAEHEALRRRFGSDVVLVAGDDFGKKSNTPATVWITVYDPGTFSSQADVQAWCRSAFSPLTGKALENVCLPRTAGRPHG